MAMCRLQLFRNSNPIIRSDSCTNGLNRVEFAGFSRSPVLRSSLSQPQLLTFGFVGNM